MTTELSTQPSAAMMEQVLLGGDLARLNTAQRLAYYKSVCESVGLNPLTKPFDYIQLNGKLQLYARKDATEQLRAIHGVSIEKLEREITEGVYVVTSYARNAKGRTDSSIGAVPIANLKGEALANGMMKAETKSKRRVTLSICGLGWLDETEVDSIPGAKHVSEAELEVSTPVDKPVEKPKLILKDVPPPAPAEPVIDSGVAQAPPPVEQHVQPMPILPESLPTDSTPISAATKTEIYKAIPLLNKKKGQGVAQKAIAAMFADGREIGKWTDAEGKSLLKKFQELSA